ncbi:MAG: amino-acid N-acetyltransferase [Acidithiobacillus ferrivorans]|uniref:Amino-acid acetyltransferase n=1 Tax=Acidithiobacillus ferrivorans TaxID=160808 RepID=A0A1B9C1Z9_9PROT|nr:amino-acid N-acetyltransferase [Acidithiobacillus ferrivorans]MBN6742214.1 amino-acid N-acetyltransferase [Acidithiobacillus sp. MC6.1]OCB03943.1 amino-acid N-acetyltransferase [Acidithiobacillus ferrivorans]
MTASGFVRGFRESSPYIHRFRGQTFVLNFGGNVLADGSIRSLAHDIALLNSLGINVVLVHGAGPQIDAALLAHQLRTERVNGKRITDLAAMQILREAVGGARLAVEAALSEGQMGSPMAHAGLQVVSGNFIIAQPLGVLEGVDYQYTGQVRRVATEAIQRHLAADEIVLLSPIGVSPTGTLFNIRAEEVAVAAALALHAAKLVFFMDEDGVTDAQGQLLRQITLSELPELLTRDDIQGDLREHLHSAAIACAGTVDRVHLISRHVDGALLRELFTRDGLGTLISQDPFEHLRTATVADIPGILDLIGPMEERGVLVRRSRERLEMEADHFVVMERDGKIIGCAAMYPYPDQGMAEVACLAVDSRYRRQGRGERLLDYCQERAREQKLEQIFVLSTQTTHWFLERNFHNGTLEDLPVPRQHLYNFQRRSQVFFRSVKA